MVQAVPGSLPEGAVSPQGLTEGVSFDGYSGPMVYSQLFVGSEIFERLRATKYTPSVSHSLDSSLREGAGNGWFHSSGCSLKSGVTGDFHRPYEGSEGLTAPIHRSTLPQSRFRSTAPSGREPGMGAYHSTHRPETATFRAIFIAPTKGGFLPSGYSLKSGVAGDFRRPYERLRNCFLLPRKLWLRG